MPCFYITNTQMRKGVERRRVKRVQTDLRHIYTEMKCGGKKNAENQFGVILFWDSEVYWVIYRLVLCTSHLGSVMARVRGTWNGHSEMVDKPRRSKGGGRAVGPNRMKTLKLLFLIFTHVRFLFCTSWGLSVDMSLYTVQTVYCILSSLPHTNFFQFYII